MAPLYRFACPQEHLLELLRPIGTEGVPCPICGQAAARDRTPQRFDVIGPTVDTRGMFRRYREASQELEHKGIDMSGAWKASKQKARAMVAAGEG